MPEYLAPGVFVEEIDSGSKPIEGVGTNTACFIGYAKSGEFNKPTFISGWMDFCRNFGEEDATVMKPLADELGRSVGDLLTAKQASRKSLVDFAASSLAEAAKARQKAGEKADGRARNWPEFVKKYDIPQGTLPYVEGSYLAYAVRGYIDNGGSRAYIVRVARPDDLELYKYTPSSAALAAGKPATWSLGPYAFKALPKGSAGNDVKVEVNHVGEGEQFTLKFTHGGKSESFGTPQKPLTPDTWKEAVKSKVIEMTATAEALFRPDLGEFTLAGGTDEAALAIAESPTVTALARVTPEDFVGDESQRSGLNGLAAVEDINMIACPDLMAGMWQRLPGDDSSVGPEVLVIDDESKERILGIQSQMISFCERMGDRCAILDPIPGLNPQEMRDTVAAAPFSCDRGHAAIYYPWIKVPDMFNKGKQVFVPPSGHMAGIWARVATDRGVHKAPANEGVRGAIALEHNVTKGEQEILNPDGINCIRSFPGTGIRAWGARTLATVGNPSWKYVNVRRLFDYLEKSIERGTQWVVFEPNDEDLWGRVRRNLSAFLFTEWKTGKLFGSVPEEAYYVKCDAELNTEEMRDLGRLYVEIGVNPVKPAEFVIIQIGQWAGGGETSET